MANEIVKLVAKKAKIAEPIAQIAVDTVMNMLKEKIPASMGGYLDAFLGNSSSSTKSKNSSNTTKSTKAKETDTLGNLGNIVGGLSGLLGGKK